MACSRVLGFLTIALCLVACFSASATATKDQVNEDLKAVIKSTGDALKQAKEELAKAKAIKNKLEIIKGKAEQAAFEAKKKMGDNVKVADLAKNARDASNEVFQLYSVGSAAAQVVLSRMTELIQTSKGLSEKSKEILNNMDTEKDYTKAAASVSAIKTEVEAMEKAIENAETVLKTAYYAERNMGKPAKDAQLAMYKVSVIADAAKIETMLKDAAADIQTAERKKGEAESIVNEIKEISKTAPEGLIGFLNSLSTNAEGELQAASRMVNEAKNAQKQLVKLKPDADDALANVEKITDEEEAGKKVASMDLLAGKGVAQFQQIKEALKSAEASAVNAMRQKQSAMKALSKSGEGEAKVKKGTGKPDQHVSDSAKSPRSGGKWITGALWTKSGVTFSVQLLLGFIACAAMH